MPEELGSKNKGKEEIGYINSLESYFEEKEKCAAIPKPVCILFTASWPPKARKFERIFSDQALSYMEKVEFYKVDIDDQKKIKAEVAVNKAPTVLVFQNNEKTPSGKITTNSASQLTNMLKQFGK